MKKKIFLSLLLAFSFRDSTIHGKAKDRDKSSSYARNAIINLSQKNIIRDAAQRDFRGMNSSSRLELVVLLAKVLELNTARVPASATFKDVPANHWAFRYVEAAYREGLVAGNTAKEFGLNHRNTREQMTVMVVRALRLLD